MTEDALRGLSLVQGEHGDGQGRPAEEERTNSYHYNYFYNIFYLTKYFREYYVTQSPLLCPVRGTW